MIGYIEEQTCKTLSANLYFKADQNPFEQIQENKGLHHQPSDSNERRILELWLYVIIYSFIVMYPVALNIITELTESLYSFQSHKSFFDCFISYICTEVRIALFYG